MGTTSDQVLTLNSDDAAALYQKAGFCAQQGETEFALENLQQAIALNPKYRKLYKSDSRFHSIRTDQRLAALTER